MDRLVLTRLESSDQGTFGILNGIGTTLYTGELPWRENAANVSCIPKGSYRGVWSWSPRFRRNVYQIIPAAPRQGIRIHSANFMGAAPKYRAQLNGCIALGLKLGVMDGQKALLLSAPAVRRFEDRLGGKDFVLEIN